MEHIRLTPYEVDIDGVMARSEPTNEAFGEECTEVGSGPSRYNWCVSLLLALEVVSTRRFRRTVEQIRDYKGVRHASASTCRSFTVPTLPRSETQLGAILDTVPDMDSKLNFPRVVRTRIVLADDDRSQ